jgi:glycosyltransferase involved in cell wall biosynthesis
MGRPEPTDGLRAEVEELRREIERLTTEQEQLRALLAVRRVPGAAAVDRWKRKARRVGLGARHAAEVAPVLVEAARTTRERRPPAGKRILMLTISGIDHDPRPNKVARSLVEHGYQVDIMAPAVEMRNSEYEVEPGIRYVRLQRESPMSLFLVYQEEYLRAAAEREFDYVHANDLTTLTAAWVIAQRRGVPLVYDAHELWTENVELRDGEWVPMSRRTRAVAGRWERFLLRHVDLLVTVGPSIVDEFVRRNDLDRPPLLLANYPSLSLLQDRQTISIREQCGLDDSHFVTLYMGGVGPLRNIESVIKAHVHLPEHHVFVVMGPGIETFGDYFRAHAELTGVADRVYFLQPVGMDDVVAAAADADCGIVMLQNICKNFWFFYPNKLFEYAAAGLPVAVSGFPDVTRFVREERCGVTFDPDSPESIAAALRSLDADREEARAMGARGRASVLERRNWETAVEGLVAAYDELGQ